MINYPLFFQTCDTFAYKHSFTELKDKMNEVKQEFRDHTVLANFIDNHDNNRFLSKNSNINILKNAALYTLFHEGIPVIYYGTEQKFNGVGDPGARECFFNSLDTSSPLYAWFQTVVGIRKSNQVG